MITEANIKWVITWIALTPLIVLSWVGHILILPFRLVTKLINKLCSPWS